MQKLEEYRVREYEKSQGLFIVHNCVSTRISGQVTDITIWIHQHGNGPMSEGKIEKVKYYFGPMFFNGKSVVRIYSTDNFEMKISAYGSVLCLAQVFIENNSEPILITRYINF